MQESLVQTILQQLLARSEREPDTYLSLAEHERTRWISEQDPEQEWRLIKMRHEGLFPDIHFNKNEAKLMLRRFLQHELDERQSNLIAIGDGIWGARVHVNRSRTRDDAFYSDLSKEESLYWLGRSTHNAFRFRMPAATVNEILHRHGVIFTASVYIMVESEGGSKYNWNSRWFWDPDRQIWICHAMARTGWDSMVVMHY
ncbi:MAG: hypothetical protein EA376_02295 [Phycisphaeraceae bacterium]|nr:MAG: hypothetical protein EA376_02295 [Phycisphaeraceae bacterium]